MYNQQQKPSFKFVIRSKLDEEKQQREESRNKSITNPINKMQPSESLTKVEDRKRKRSDKDSTSGPPIATKKVVVL
jgi:hypothetical protein